MLWGGLPLIVVLLLLVLAGWLWYYAGSLEEKTGLPSGSILYNDSEAWSPNTKPLYANNVGLVGKPDYLIEEAGGMIIPVELKSMRAPAEPREGHILQLAAYCFLVETNYGVRPDHGVLQYKDKAFAIDYTTELEDDLLDVLAEMRAGLFEPDLPRDHNDWRKCARCGVRQHCYDRLA